MNTDQIRAALLARSGQPSTGQQPVPPTLSQTGATPAIPRPVTPQPMGQPSVSAPPAQPLPAFDDETKKISKVLISKLLTVL
jgi:hypothetical protein